MVKIKTAEEQARLDEIFAEIEAEERRMNGEPEPVTEAKRNESNRVSNETRIANLDFKQLVGTVRSIKNANAFKTRWERILANVLLDRIAPMNEELNLLRNFANAVCNRLEKAEKSAKEQDNHHYYKIFAEGVKGLLEAI